MSDEDTILEARKYVPLYQRRITWSAGEQIWIAEVPEFPGFAARGSSADEAKRASDEALLELLIDMAARREKWPPPLKLR